MLSLKYPESDSSVLLLPYAGLAPPATAAALHRREAEINPRRERQTHRKHTEINALFAAVRVQTRGVKEKYRIFLFFLAFRKFLAITLKCRYSHHASVFFSPMMPSLLIV